MCTILLRFQELEEPNIHLRLKTWDFIYRLCFIRGTATSGIFDCKEETFLELLNLIQFGNLLKVAEINVSFSSTVNT